MAVEAEAILNIVTLWEAGRLELVSSAALLFEAEQIPLSATSELERTRSEAQLPCFFLGTPTSALGRSLFEVGRPTSELETPTSELERTRSEAQLPCFFLGTSAFKEKLLKMD